jgi:hypothetical protein
MRKCSQEEKKKTKKKFTQNKSRKNDVIQHRKINKTKEKTEEEEEREREREKQQSNNNIDKVVM